MSPISMRSGRATTLTDRTALIAVALLTVAACAPQQTPIATEHPPGPRDRAQVMAALRSVDPCLLYGTDARIGDHPITIEGMTSTLSCAAQVQAAAGPADISLGVNIASPGAARPPAGDHRTIDGVDVTVASTSEPPLLGPDDAKVVTASCNFTARYPDLAIVSVFASAAPDVDTCTIAEAVMRRAIANYGRPPSPNEHTLGRTVLTGADPCASVRRLEPPHAVSIDLDNSALSDCFFTLDASPPVVVSFDYLDAAVVANTPPAQNDVAGHRVLGGDGIVHVVVGDEFTVADKHLVPTVTITDLPPSAARMHALVEAIAEHY